MQRIPRQFLSMKASGIHNSKSRVKTNFEPSEPVNPFVPILAGGFKVHYYPKGSEPLTPTSGPMPET